MTQMTLSGIRAYRARARDGGYAIQRHLRHVFTETAGNPAFLTLAPPRGRA